ncbi:MAG: hypothetical protein WD556_02375 [Actinomycetota bacterium]
MTEALELPGGWTWLPLGEVADATLGKTPRRADYRDNGKYRIVKYRDLTSHGLDFGETKDAYVVDNPAALKGLRRLEPGDILIGASGHDGSTVGRKLALVDQLPGVDSDPTFFVGELLRIRPRTSETDSRWLLHYFSSEEGYRALQRAVSGGHLTNGRARQILVPMAPPDIQKPLSDLLDGARGRAVSASGHLAAAGLRIERFRQAVLAAACSGRVTADWRDERLPVDRVGRGAVDGIRLARRGLPKSMDPEVIPRPEGEETPASWDWVRLGSVIGELRNGVSVAPAMEPPGVPTLRISAVRAGVVDLEDHRFLRDDPSKWQAFAIREGDLLFTRYNGSLALLGVCGMVRGLGKRFILHPDKLMRVRFDHGLIAPAFAEIFFAGLRARERMTAGAVSSAGQQGVSGATVKAQPFVLPPLDEQEEISRRVTELLRLADELATRLVTASDSIDRGMAALTTKAFRGELFLESAR